MKVSIKTTSTIGILVWLAIVIAVVYGYIANIVKLASHVGAFGILELVRAIGIVAGPLGVIMGYVG